MSRIKRWLMYISLGALLTLGISAVPTASGHRTMAAKKAEFRQDARLARHAAKDAKKDAADQARELTGLKPAFSENEEEAQDEENEATDEQEENEDEQDENEQTAEEDEQEEGEEAEDGTQDGANDEQGEAPTAI